MGGAAHAPPRQTDIPCDDWLFPSHTSVPLADLREQVWKVRKYASEAVSGHEPVSR